MKWWYLVGEPWFGPGLLESRKKFSAPVGQVAACQEVLRETQDSSTVIDKLREEYLAIVQSLKEMGVDFRIIYAHPDEVDEALLGTCIDHLGCRLVRFAQDYFPTSLAYPRDFATVLPGVMLVNSQLTRVLSPQKAGWSIFASPYGEGGRVLHQQQTALVSERLILKDGHSVKPRVGKLRELGIRVGLLPPFISAEFLPSDRSSHWCSFNDHLDRVGSLIQGKDRGLHLVVDPQIHTADWKGRERHPPWVGLPPKKSLERIKRTCETFEIEVRCPRGGRLRVPYSLNLEQFPDGRVLMTGGDDAVAEVVGEIVGEEDVFRTSIPIRFFPVWLYAGIRCLINQAPPPLFTKKASAQ